MCLLSQFGIKTIQFMSLETGNITDSQTSIIKIETKPTNFLRLKNIFDYLMQY